MSPIVQGQADPDKAPYQWVHLEDFSAGLVDASNVASAKPTLTAPLGAANPEGTWCCAALGHAGLGPLPKMVRRLAGPTLPATPTYVVGLAVTPKLATATAEVVVMLEADNGTTHYFRVYSVTPTGTATSILTKTHASHTNFFGCPFPAYTRARTSTPTLLPGTPVLVFPSSYDASPTGQLWVYPSPTARTTYGAKTIRVATVSGISGLVVIYSNRILCLTGVPYHWPGGDVASSENINFTTPPNSYTYLNQQTVLAAEDPWGYGAAGSISTGELMLVKRQGGGVMVNGDIFDPSSVLYLPGVQPTGLMFGKPAPTEEGLFYCSENQGAWVWDGGNVSVKVSQNLRDDFWDVGAKTITFTGSLGFLCQRWGRFVAFSNNYLYDITAGAWWVLYPNASNGTTKTPGRTFFWFYPGTHGNQLWAAPWELTTATDHWLYLFTNAVAAPHWQWKSLPIHVVPTANHVCDVRQVLVRASSPDPTAKLTVKIGTWTGQTTPATSPIGTSPTPIRFNVGAGALGLDDIVITLVGDQTTTGHSPPIVHSVDIAYQVRQHVASVN